LLVEVSVGESNETSDDLRERFALMHRVEDVSERIEHNRGGRACEFIIYTVLWNQTVHCRVDCALWNRLGSARRIR
jgi:hypothetical protein